MLNFQKVEDTEKLKKLKEIVKKRLSGGYYRVGHIPEDQRTLEGAFNYFFYLHKDGGCPENIHIMYGAALDKVEYKLQNKNYSSAVYVYGENSDLTEWLVLVLEKSLYGDWVVTR